MTYEEKRELRLQISQLLSDAGLNQKAIKDMVEEEIRNKVERAVSQKLKQLNAECYSGDFIREKVSDFLFSGNVRNLVNQAVKEELKNRVINVTLCGLDDVTVVK